MTLLLVVTAGRYDYERIDLPADRQSLLDPAVAGQSETARDCLVRSLRSPACYRTYPFQPSCAVCRDVLLCRDDPTGMGLVATMPALISTARSGWSCGRQRPGLSFWLTHWSCEATQSSSTTAGV